MSEVFDFSEWNEDEGAWQVPEYLANMYGLWTSLGNVTEGLKFSHFAAEQASAGYTLPDGTVRPPDGIMDAFLDSPSDDEEVRKQQTGEGRVITAHDLLLTAQAALTLLMESLARRLESMDSLPPWWKEDYDATDDRPMMGFEIDMLRRMLEDDDDGEA